ncbi:UTP--glucose-1-phosphate uridylyltransferase GalU [Prosthecomicrobium pneumaticum]|uniref:UTP--glucose-1-phosphate uridylyltransferase n=1 Tax=Prosthecomicrobium pneumaticum TaxID=81895 RepID=A0A7W9CV87_9HYPH|nr:UTP--glucose-1-phosphate uridylyltransferase GalU [Prosthecomicrobium pneumaticum]MBB5752527.1 UTP--glucose-1-phosphate uridylyltransferase [Prosthecomicrobium pneumaticum]
MNRPIRKAVFPVAGLGTRFLPATKAMPKEMLPVVDRPVIQHAVDEAREAGIEHFIFVTGRNKGVIEDHFDIQYELEATLAGRGKDKVLDQLRSELPKPGTTSFTRQQEPLGLGHAIWCARELVGDEPFAVLLPDMVTKGQPSCLAQMVDVYRETGGNVISVEECDPKMTDQYGIVGIGSTLSERAFRIDRMVEKPKPDIAPSNLYINGRYILQPQIFEFLSRQQRGAGNEIQLTDAMLALMQRQYFYGCRFDGRTFDCGHKVGFLIANVAFALDRPDLSGEFRRELEALIATLPEAERQAIASAAA